MGIVLGRARRERVAALPLLVAPAANAHTGLVGHGDFLAGFLHPLSTIEDVLAYLAIGILAALQSPRCKSALPLFWIANAGGLAAALALPVNTTVDAVNIASLVILGGIVAADVAVPRSLLFGTALAFGASHGVTNGAAVVSGIAPYLFLPGAATAAIVASAYGYVTTENLLQEDRLWIRIALRTAGSWLAAIGMLVLATTWKARFG